MQFDNLNQLFNKNGYVIINPNDLQDTSFFNKLADSANKLLPRYKDGEVDSRVNNSREDPRFYHENKIGNLLYNGCPLEHRYRLGQGSADTTKDTNYLYGRRVILPERNFNKELVGYIENEKILNLVSGLFETDSKNLSFHNGSLSRVFPGCTGESKKIHIDTPGFIKNRTSHLKEDKFIINVFTFLSDISEELAPMRVVPGSHKRYKDINKALAKSFNGSITKNNVTQAGHIYDELLEGLDLGDSKKLTGKAGTIVVMNSGLLHSATENFTKDLFRDVIIANYSKRTDTEFRKSYFKDYPEDSKKLMKLASNRELFKRSFSNNFKNNLDEFSIKPIIRKNLNKIKSFKDFLYPYYSKSKRIFHQKSKNKKYLNVGAGNGWRHNDFISLDLAQDIEINFNLNIDKKLPFEDNSIKGIYTSHCLEHLRYSEVKYWLKDFYRILLKGSILRITVPNIILYLDAYEEKDASFFNWIRSSGSYAYDSWLRSIIRQFASPVVDNYSDEELYKMYSKKDKIEFLNYFEKEVDLIKDDKLLWPSIHKSWWSNEKFVKELKECGFSKVNILTQNTSGNNIFIGKEFNRTRPHMSLYIEGIK